MRYAPAARAWPCRARPRLHLAGAWWCGLMTEQPPEPNGLVYQPDFLTQAEEQEVLDVLKAMEFHPITMHGQTARRTVRHFGLGYGYASWKLEPTDPLPHNLGAGCVRLLGARLPRRHGPLRPGRLPAPRHHRAAAQPHRPDPTVPGTGTRRPDQGSGRQRRPTPPAHRTSDGRSRAGVPLHTRRTRGARWASGGRHISPTPHPGQS